MKKILSIIISAAMLTGLAACGAENGAGAGPGINHTAYALSSPDTAEQAQYPDEQGFYKNGEFDYEGYDRQMSAWSEEARAREDAAKLYSGRLNGYINASVPAFLGGQDGQNVICSPVNIYMALAMLAECTDGETRAQILDVLGAASLEELRSTAQSLWKANHHNDGMLTELLGSSIWLNDNMEINGEAVNALSLYYYASVYRGDAADRQFSEAFKEWLDEQTGGLLSDQIQALEPFDEDLVAAIATSIYFKGSWEDEFSESENELREFRAASGNRNAVYMNRTDDGQYYRGKAFGAVRLPFNGGASMWILLPDEGVSPESIVKDGSAAGFILDPDTAYAGAYKISLSLPQFDLSSSLSLIEDLKSLGITDAFIPGTADLTPLTPAEAYVSSVTHDARVKIDEEGCEAAAFTVIAVEATSAAAELPAMDFNVDRPFVFMISGIDGLPMFSGIVNDVD